jgi:Periplasmic binding protein
MKAELRRLGALAGVCVMAAGGLAACGSSSSSSSSGSSSSASAGTGAAASTGRPAASSSVLGSPKPAHGTPVTFGMINIESNPQASFPEIREAAQAGIDYVNAYGGGLDGHPIKLDLCITDGSPATSVQCANKLIAAHPTAILGAGDLSGANTLPPSTADASSTLASAIGNSPDAFLLEDPSQCVAILTGLKSLGNTKPVLSIDPCSAPAVIKASAGAANGMYWFQPFQDLYAADQTPDVVLAKAILAKYAPATIAVDSPALAGLSTVMNVWNTYKTTPTSKLTTAYILKTLRTGTHKAFLSTSWNCAAQPIKKEPAVCNADQYLYQIKGSTPTLVATGYHLGANIG